MVKSDGPTVKVKKDGRNTDRKRKDRDDGNGKQDVPDGSSTGRSISRLWGPGNVKQNPKRGAPGILMTCEQGKEFKCKREGLEILHHYYSKIVHQQKDRAAPTTTVDGSSSSSSSSSSSLGTPKAETNLSLEDELKALKNAKADDESKKFFEIFSTGCRGIVFALCTIPGCEMIPLPRKESSKSPKATVDADADATTDESQPENNETEQPLPKRHKDDVATAPRTEGPPKVPSRSAVHPQWDPVPIVRQILQDIEHDTGRDAPSSRFVTRMVPLQATCFASQADLQGTARPLLRRYLGSNAVRTFAIVEKRRMCTDDRLSRQQIIDTIAKEVCEVAPEIKVNLSNPDVTVLVEVCKTMCGISIVPKYEDFRHFNLATARDEKNKKDEEETER